MASRHRPFGCRLAVGLAVATGNDISWRNSAGRSCFAKEKGVAVADKWRCLLQTSAPKLCVDRASMSLQRPTVP